MSDPQTPLNVWEMLFEQTPTLLRWALGVLTLGVFSLAGLLYRWHREDMERVNARIDRLEANMHASQQETNRLLLEISQNTSSRS
ncbi:hypothetical protein ACFQH5_20290 [Halomonas salifodinae]|uniref:Uncharacterized protein n=1 Tax=Halomonas salifodinae TaxID=438745 RepID=A0ABW2F4E1_9GAMM